VIRVWQSIVIIKPGILDIFHAYGSSEEIPQIRSEALGEKWGR
jgi:hypothetical protein